MQLGECQFRCARSSSPDFTRCSSMPPAIPGFPRFRCLGFSTIFCSSISIFHFLSSGNSNSPRFRSCALGTPTPCFLCSCFCCFQTKMPIPSSSCFSPNLIPATSVTISHSKHSTTTPNTIMLQFIVVSGGEALSY